jgi:alpha-L-fucosidase
MAGLVKKAREKQPQLIVVDRAVPGVHQNYLTPEQHIPDNGLPYPWETCMTMAGSWSYVPNDQYKPSNELIEKLVDIVSKGGNYLLNIGPSPEGELDPVAYQRLKDIGKWMKINGEAIYSTRMHEVFGEGENIRYTASKDKKTTFVFLFNFPENEKTVLTQLKINPSASVQMLGYAKPLKWSRVTGGLEIQIPKAAESASEHVWVLKVQAGK